MGEHNFKQAFFKQNNRPPLGRSFRPAEAERDQSSPPRRESSSDLHQGYGGGSEISSNRRDLRGALPRRLPVDWRLGESGQASWEDQKFPEEEVTVSSDSDESDGDHDIMYPECDLVPKPLKDLTILDPFKVGPKSSPFALVTGKAPSTLALQITSEFDQGAIRVWSVKNAHFSSECNKFSVRVCSVSQFFTRVFNAFSM
ncbi:uncharacterized protein [Engystomops pustulosus]|uniref:uncharacterized protein n=1 Tax=Engystomops pustulosus TaxID=76066 RepID=UPI003AFAD3AE